MICAHVDDTTVARVPEACGFMSKCLSEEFQTTRVRSFKRDRKEGIVHVS